MLELLALLSSTSSPFGGEEVQGFVTAVRQRSDGSEVGKGAVRNVNSNYRDAIYSRLGFDYFFKIC